MIRTTAIAALFTGLLLPGLAMAQTQMALGGLAADPSAPVEVTAESLSVDQATGRATFEGDVLIGQGEMKISAATVEVVYDEATGEIARLEAEGGVTFVTATEAAEAESAVYDISGGTLTLIGDVLLTQGRTALSSQRMEIDLAAGTAQLTGGVRSVIEPAQ
ncbi:LptA/OstA family protein [Limimaricola cinnabarinus]|uniref:Protein-glutamate methylesterase family protein n=1 Tax=Limimaricola cinnabarinus LL-001 TaxID=1337093 RepID=U2Z101_9RHOB|nr:LptA/OstA family protein [Limimaricola cinnabarinus]GAD54762.1 protein-glutamate methylesterase family protein [Limimaricola cinnabarinus LL-001]